MSSALSYVMDKRSPKSPIPRSPFPKSPMPQSPELYGKYKSRCAYSFIRLFHFGQNQSKKLISDHRPLERHAAGNERAKIGLDLPSNADGKQPVVEVENETVVVDSDRAGMKKFMSKDMHIEGKIKRIPAAKVENVKSSNGVVGDQSSNSRKTSKSYRRPRRLPIYGCYDVATMKQMKPSDQDKDDRSAETSVSSQVNPKRGRDCNSETTNNRKEINIQVHMNEAAEAFINQKLIDGKHLSRDGAKVQSKHFMDALDTLNCNKDLFIKLIQDPNSLLAKHIEDLRDFQDKEQPTKSFTEATLTSEPSSNETGDEEPFSSLNFTPSDSDTSKGTGDPQILEKIVVLRPGTTSLQNFAGINNHDSPPQAGHRVGSVQQSVRPSFFPFIKMKKRLMHAMGVSKKDQQLIPADAAERTTHHFHSFEKCNKKMDMEKVDRKSPERSSSDLGAVSMSSTDVEKDDQIEKMMVRENAESCDISGKNSTSPIVANGNTSFLRKQKTKSWDGIDPLPEYDFLPVVSRRKKKENDSVSPNMRFSLYGSNDMGGKIKPRSQRNNKSSFSSQRQNIESPMLAGNEEHYDQVQLFETKPEVLDKVSSNVTVDGKISFPDNECCFTGPMETAKKVDSRISEESSSSCVTTVEDGSHKGAAESTCAVKTSTEKASLDFHRLDSSTENQELQSSAGGYPSSPSSLERVCGIKDRTEQPSPVSVLENCPIEDSPLSRESHCAEPLAMPLLIGIEDECLAALVPSTLNLKISSSDSVDEHSMLNYVGAFLRTSGFNLGELISKCQLSERHFHQSRNRKLLNDYFVEVIAEIYRCQLGRYWASLTKPRIGPVTEKVVHEVMKKVDQNLFLQPSPRTLDQLCEKDLSEAGIWIDTAIDVEDVVTEMVDSIVEEVIMESVME
ncbi:hypothetical protein Tsubulata_015496 [Turnera subulata]|uniref:DUF4378 domain-containing protein n=1 Tax=Turnera subulata TaxID=218843 RepID=A0A9Q0JAL3_9ROSI|nr:hypothetical protein Tsubulata_015496 [Turnera subulata]